MENSNNITSGLKDFIIKVTIGNKTTTIVDILEGKETPSEAVVRILKEENLFPSALSTTEIVKEWKAPQPSRWLKSYRLYCIWMDISPTATRFGLVVVDRVTIN